MTSQKVYWLSLLAFMSTTWNSAQIQRYILILMTLFSISNTDGSTNGIEDVTFKPSQICGTASELLASNCTIPMTQITSNLKCAVECGKNSTCLGSFMDDSTTCHFLKMCDYAWDNMNCEINKATNFVRVPRKMCRNEGQFTRKKGIVCRCKRGMIGDFCTIRATSCEELVGYGYEMGVSYTAVLKLKSQKTISVRCRNGYTETVTGLFSNSGKYNHSRSWRTYERGYYLSKNDYWLGLENMHAITNMNKTSVVQWGFYFRMENSKTGSMYKTSESIYYHGFRVGNESIGYAYTYESAQLSSKGIETPMGDCLNHTQNVPFSTWDNDNDQEPEINLAKLSNAGWWFKSRDTTIECNPLGMSVKTLPNSSTNGGQIAIKNFDMVNSTYGQTFRRLEVDLIMFKP